MSKTKMAETTQEERLDSIREAWDNRHKDFIESMDVYGEMLAISNTEKENLLDIIQAHYAGTYDEQSIHNGGMIIKYGNLDNKFSFKVYDHKLFNTAVKEIRAIINRQATRLGHEPPKKVTWNMHGCNKHSDTSAAACYSIEIDDERWSSTYTAPLWTKCYEMTVYFDPDKPPANMIKDPENPGKCGWSKPESRSYIPSPEWECHAE